MNYTCKKLGKQYEIVYANGKMYKCNERVPDTYALNIEWGANGIGFGELNIHYNEKTGKWSKNYDTEDIKSVVQCQELLGWRFLPLQDDGIIKNGRVVVVHYATYLPNLGLLCNLAE